MVFHRENKSSLFLIIDRPGNSKRYISLDEINQAKLILEQLTMSLTMVQKIPLVESFMYQMPHTIKL